MWLLFGLLLSNSSYTKKPLVGWSSMIYSSVNSSMISFISSISVFFRLILPPRFLSCCPWRLSLVSIQKWDMNQKWVFPSFDGSSIIFRTSPYIGSSIHASLWISFPVYRDTNKCLLYSFDSLNNIPGMLLKLILFSVYNMS